MQYDYTFFSAINIEIALGRYKSVCFDRKEDENKDI